MQVGDIVKVKDCVKPDCMCFFCCGNSNRVGFISQGRIEVLNEKSN